MKILASAVALLAFAMSTAHASRPLLVQKVGGLAHLGTVQTCEIYENHPAIQGDTDRINELIKQALAKGDLELVANFAKAQVPTVEVYANLVTVNSIGEVSQLRVDLVKIYGAHDERTSPEAQELIQLVNDSCK